MFRSIFLIICFCIMLIQTMIVSAETVSDGDVVVAAITANSIFSSQDKGQTWKERVITEFPESSREKTQLMAITCTGKGKKALCVAAGMGKSNVNYYGIPFLAVSQNGGETWDVKLVSNVSHARLNAVNCSNSVCVVVGRAPSTGAIAVTSTDNGNHWENKIASLHEARHGFADVSCMNSGTCIAIGDKRQVFSPTPYAAYSVDYGNTWNITQNFPRSSSYNNIEAMTCVDDVHHPLCMAVGASHERDGVYHTMILTSTDWGKSWEKKSLPLNPYYPVANAVSCIKDVVTHRPRCFIAGYDGPSAGYASMSIDDGNSWQENSLLRTIPPLTVNCTGSGIVGTCVIGGCGYAVSRNGGTSWTVKYSTDRNSGEAFGSSHCTGSGASDSVCLLGGSLGNVAISSDGGKNWKHNKLADKPFVSVAATGGRT